MFTLTIISKKPLDESSKEQIRKLLDGTTITNWERKEKIAASYAETVYIQSLSTDLKNQLFELSDALKIDIIAQQEAKHKKSLAVFDMDSTLIQAECIDLIAASVGVGEQVAAITEAAMRGELDFTQSLESRVALLKGVPNTIYDDLKKQIEFMPGAKELAKGLKAKNIKLAVLSGGFVPIAQWVKSTLEFDHAHANTLSESDGKLTGVTEGPIVDGNRKAELLQSIAKEHGVPLEEVLAVGDGSNDLPMMGVAGFGVAFSAKPLVQRKAPSRLNSGNLSDILYLV